LRYRFHLFIALGLAQNLQLSLMLVKSVNKCPSPSGRLIYDDLWFVYHVDKSTMSADTRSLQFGINIFRRAAAAVTAAAAAAVNQVKVHTGKVNYCGHLCVYVYRPITSISQ